MRRIAFLFFLTIFFSFDLEAKSPDRNFRGCNYDINEKNLKEINKLNIKKISVDVNNYRNWIVNSIRILTSRSRYVSDSYKRRFNSNISVEFEDGSFCNFVGRIRHHGDEKDHISLAGNTIIQSIDVHLDDGNIRGITKFKLLRPNTRGKLEDEIFLTELLRNLNFLAPRTMKIDVRVNEANSIMIFQEKAAKELLEFNKRREGPILEADERFFFRSVNKLPSNQKSNWDIGVVPLMNNSVKHLLARQENTNIMLKSEGLNKMSFNSSTNLNLIYLYYSNKFQDGTNNFHYFDYDLDNTLLAMFNPENISKLDMYNLLIQSTNGQHGLAANNRKFFWNSIENYFEPINYDSNANIDLKRPTTTTTIYRLPISENFLSSFGTLEDKLLNLNLKKISVNISNSGIKMSEKEVSEKIKKILNNLNVIKINYLNIDNNALLEHNKFKPIDNLLDRFNETLNEVEPNVFLVKYNESSGNLQRCKIFLKDCKDYNFSQENLTDLLEGELILNEKIYQFLGKSLNFDSIKKNRNFNIMNLNDSKIFYEDGITIKLDQQNNLLEFTQNEVGSRAYIINGILSDLKIKFYNFNNDILVEKPKNYPNDSNGLTGCLSLINLEVKNIELSAQNSNCEDAINLINVRGLVNKVVIDNSYSDGLDVDFSNVKIKNLDIQNSKNDCVDFSSGNYVLGELILSDCGDKALSVGEGSRLKIDKIKASNSKTGVASKDSSIVDLNNVNVENVSVCLAAYKKKQEFNGGVINIGSSFYCNNFENKQSVDKFSVISN